MQSGDVCTSRHYLGQAPWLVQAKLSDDLMSRRPLPWLRLTKKSLKTRDRMAISFMTMLSAGPDVSFKGSGLGSGLGSGPGLAGILQGVPNSVADNGGLVKVGPFALHHDHLMAKLVSVLRPLFEVLFRDHHRDLRLGSG